MATTTKSSKIVILPVSQLVLNEKNRLGLGLNQEHITLLADSIKKEGWLPFSILEVIKLQGDGNYEIHSGNHRFEAGKIAGIEEFPCIVLDTKKLSETDRIIRDFAANRSLGNSPLETALLVGELSRSGMKNKAIAARLFPGKKGSESVVSQFVAFNRECPPWLISAIEDGKISFSQAKEIAGEKDVDSKREEIEARTPENPWQKIRLVQGPAIPAPSPAPTAAPIAEKADTEPTAQGQPDEKYLEQIEKTRNAVKEFKNLLGIQVRNDGSEFDLSMENGVFSLTNSDKSDEIKSTAQKLLESIFGAENTQKQIAKQTLANVSSVSNVAQPTPAPTTIGPESAQATEAKPNPEFALPATSSQPVVITLETIAGMPLPQAVTRLLELKDEGDAQKLDEMLAAKHGRETLDAEVDRQDGEASKVDIAPTPTTTGQQNNPKQERKGMVSIRKTPGRVRALARELSGMLASLPMTEVGGQAEWVDKHTYISADGRALLRIMLDGKAYLLTLGDDCVG